MKRKPTRLKLLKNDYKEADSRLGILIKRWAELDENSNQADTNYDSVIETVNLLTDLSFLIQYTKKSRSKNS